MAWYRQQRESSPGSTARERHPRSSTRKSSRRSGTAESRSPRPGNARPRKPRSDRRNADRGRHHHRSNRLHARAGTTGRTPRRAQPAQPPPPARRASRSTWPALHRLPPQTRADQPHEPRSATSCQGNQQRNRGNASLPPPKAATPVTCQPSTGPRRPAGSRHLRHQRAHTRIANPRPGHPRALPIAKACRFGARIAHVLDAARAA
jgi:hypothetical protein